jgi:hypothetical protein
MRHKRSTFEPAVTALAVSPTMWGNAPVAQAAPENADTVPRPVETSAPVPAGFASWQGVLAEQERLNGVADAIVEASGDSGTDEGFGAVTADPVDHAMGIISGGVAE